MRLCVLQIKEYANNNVRGRNERRRAKLSGNYHSNDGGAARQIFERRSLCAGHRAEQARRRFLFIRARPKANTEGMVPFVAVVRLNGDWRRKGWTEQRHWRLAKTTSTDAQLIHRRSKPTRALIKHKYFQRRRKTSFSNSAMFWCRAQHTPHDDNRLTSVICSRSRVPADHAVPKYTRVY